MQDRLVAEIPALPAVWRITFELKRTAEEKFCCRICNHGIITVVGGDLWPMISLPRIAYSCASHDKRRNRTTKAEIDISHQLDGKFSLKKKREGTVTGGVEHFWHLTRNTRVQPQEEVDVQGKHCWIYLQSSNMLSWFMTHEGVFSSFLYLSTFLAVHNSSIGDLVTNWLTQSLWSEW